MAADTQVMRTAMMHQDATRAQEAARYAAEVRQLSDARLVDVGRMQAMREQMAVTAKARPAAPPASLIDFKGNGKPKSFSSKAEDWNDFSFTYLKTLLEAPFRRRSALPHGLRTRCDN